MCDFRNSSYRERPWSWIIWQVWPLDHNPVTSHLSKWYVWCLLAYRNRKSGLYLLNKWEEIIQCDWNKHSHSIHCYQQQQRACLCVWALMSKQDRLPWTSMSLSNLPNRVSGQWQTEPHCLCQGTGWLTMYTHTHKHSVKTTGHTHTLSFVHTPTCITTRT